MGSMKLGSLDIALPYVARTLCEDAVNLADELRGNLSDDDFLAFSKEFRAGYGLMCQEIMEKGEPSYGFNPFQLMSFPEELVNDESKLNDIFSKYQKSAPFIKLLLDAATGEHDVQSAALLLLYIDIIRSVEIQGKTFRRFKYEALMQSLSPHIYNLHKILVVLSTMPSQAEVFATNYKRKQGARRGGAAKAARNQELKDLVLAEAESLHQNIDATKAAQTIHKKLTEQGNWLQDDNGKPILKDPVVRFTAWIREARSKKLH